MRRPEPHVKWRCRRNYHLRVRQLRQFGWTRRQQADILRRFQTTYKNYRIRKKHIHGRKVYYFQRQAKWVDPRARNPRRKKQKRRPRKRFTRDFERQCRNQGYQCTQSKLWRPTQQAVDDLLRVSDFMAMHRKLQQLSDPTLLAAGQRDTTTTCRLTQARTAAAAYFQEDYLPVNQTELHHAYLTRQNTEPPIVIDSGASFSVTPVLDDFTGPIKPCKVSDLKGLNSTIEVQGEGNVEWKVRDVYGKIRIIKTKAYFVRDAGVRLFSPQVYFQRQNKGNFTMKATGTTLTLGDDSTLEFPYAGHNNLPIMLTARHFSRHVAMAGLTLTDVQTMQDPSTIGTYLNVADETNQNMTAAQKELLLWHQKMGHIEMQTVQMLLAEPRNPDNEQIIRPMHRKASSCNRPMCIACNFAKMGRRGAGANHGLPDPEVQNELRRDDLEPGYCVSMDQYMSSTPGRLPNTRGREPQRRRYTGGTMFVDHASQFIHCTHQTSLRVGETLRAKRDFERLMNEYGRRVRKYHADNAPFRSQEFMADIQNRDQEIEFSAVGAHHQNGVVERAIRTVTGLARAMLLHAILHWPDAAELDLWPMAMDQAVYIWNNTPKRGSRLSPYELFTGMRQRNRNNLTRLHVFGCPTYVLDPRLQDGKRIPKWQPRARRGMYLGVSKLHSTNVGRILNLETGSISEQYHCVYDDLFSTTPTNLPDIEEEGRFDRRRWQNLVESGHERTLDQEFDEQGRPIPLPELDEDWLTARERELRRQIRRDRQALRRRRRFDQRDFDEEQRQLRHQREPHQREPNNRLQRELQNLRELHLPEEEEGTTTENDDDTSTLFPSDTTFDSNDTSELDTTDDDPTDSGQPTSDSETTLESDNRTRTRTGRAVQPPRRLIQEINLADNKRVGFPGENLPTYNDGHTVRQKIRAGRLNDAYINGLDWDRALHVLKTGTLGKMWNELETHTDQIEETVEWMNPALLTAQANASDTPTWHQAMAGPDAEGYWQAARKEIGTLTDMEVWEEVDREEWMNIIPSTWAFRCKRYPDGRIKKLKARFCARGDRQIEGIDYFETYAPVVNWQTVRIMLVMSILLQLASTQVDYTAAFVHADIDRDPNWDSLTQDERDRSGVFIEMPKGFAKPGKVLKLKKSLYGLKQSPRNFFNHLKEKLITVGFEQTEADPCLFISEKVICLVYVDDTLFFAQDQQDIDDTIQKLRDENMTLEVEEDVAGFLGVHIERKPDGRIEMLQSGLTERVIRALNIGDKPTKRTPADSGCLGKDEGGEPAQGTYNYASVIGMLQYLQGHTRPDIAFAVAQCARFTHSPKRSHEKALEWIGQYLKGTQDKGLIFNPTSGGEGLQMDCYVDADFAGLWGAEDRGDPSCAKSRTGYVIFIQNCPVVWVSKLQTDIALSTMESEYNALSMSLRDILPLQNSLRTIAKGLGITQLGTITFKGTEKVKTKVHEDNMGAMKLANMEPGRMTPRSKHYAVKYHWFRSKLKPNEIEIVRVDSLNQRADFLTKSLKIQAFEANRKLTCGW